LLREGGADVADVENGEQVVWFVMKQDVDGNIGDDLPSPARLADIYSVLPSRICNIGETMSRGNMDLRRNPFPLPLQPTAEDETWAPALIYA
jgi:hypothetical protein